MLKHQVIVDALSPHLDPVKNFVHNFQPLVFALHVLNLANKKGTKQFKMGFKDNQESFWKAVFFQESLKRKMCWNSYEPFTGWVSADLEFSGLCGEHSIDGNHQHHDSQARQH